MSERKRLTEIANDIHRAAMKLPDWKSNLATRRAYSAAIIRALRADQSRGCTCGGAVKAIDLAYVAGFRNGRIPGSAPPPGLETSA